MSEFKDLQPEVCEDIEFEPPQKICPTCKPDPNFVEPTWWLTDEPYLNKKICEYQINMVSTKSVSGLSQNEIQYEARKMVKKAIRTILRQLGKLETNEIVCAFPPKRKNQKCRLYIPPNLLVKLESENLDKAQILDNIAYNKQDPEDRFNLDSLEVAARIYDIYYGDNFELFQVLVSIPVEAINAVPESPFTNEEQEEINEDAESTEEVELDGYDFRGNVRKIQAAFLLYGKYQQIFSYTQDIRLLQYIDSSYIPFYLNKYRKRIEGFKEELKFVIKKNGFRLTSIKSRKTVTKIKIKFMKNEPLKIKSIFVKKKGCPYEKLRGIDSLKAADPTTVNYIVNLDKMVDKLSFKGEDVPWLDFITEHTYPALEINFGNIDNNEEPLNSCINQDSVENYKDNILRSLLSFSETIQFAISTKECKTLQEITENNPYERQRFNLKESLKKQSDKAKLKANRRKQTRALKETLQQRVESLIEVSTAAEAKELVNAIEQDKKRLKDFNSEDDVLKQLRLEKRIKNSIHNLLRDQMREIDKKIDEVQDDESLTVDAKVLLAGDLSKKKDLLDDERSRIFDEIVELQKKIDEEKDEIKSAKKADRKLKRKLTYDKIKDLYGEAYDRNREELGLIESLREAKNSDRSGFLLLNSLNPCKWDQVSLQVIECLLGGMSFAEALPLIISSALRNSNPYVLENLLIGLPIEERKSVVEKVKVELKKISEDLADNFKEPWETQKEKDKAEDNADSSADNQKILDDNPPDKITKEDHKEAKQAIGELKKKIKEEKKNLEYFVINEKTEFIPDQEKKIEELEKELKEKIGDFKEKRKSAGTPALANVAGIIFDAYVKAITESLSVDRLTALLDDIPGANIFKKLVMEATCPRVNTLRSGVKDAFGSISIELCEPGTKNYFLPAIPDLPRFRGIGLSFALSRMINLFQGALADLLAELIIALIIRILDLIESGLCNSIGVLGALLANALTGQKGKQGWLDAVNDAFCENEGARDDTASDLLGKAGIPNNRRTDIGNALSSAATKDEIKRALISDCEDQNPKVMKAIWAVINASGLRLNGMFQTPDDVRDMFCMMGSYLTPDQKKAVEISLGTEDVPVNSSICLTNEERQKWDENRRQFYENQGLDPMAARDFVNGLNNKMNRDLTDMLDGLAKGPEGLLEDALAEALTPRDPNCVDATNSLLPPLPEEMDQVMKSISEGVFGSLAYSFTADMVGKGDSFFENVLADQRGVRLSYGLFSHERRVGFDLLYPNAANTEQEHEQKFEEAGLLQKTVMKAASEGSGDPDPDHLFPATIGLYLHQSLNEVIEEQFITTTDKDGKRKIPDLLLKFRNQSTQEALDFDFGFNIAYNHFKYPDSFIKSDEYSARKFDIVKFYDVSTGITNTSKYVDIRVNSSHGISKYKEVLDKYDITESQLTMPYVTQLFGEVIKERYSKAGATNLKSENIGQSYDAINNLIYKGLMKGLITDDRNQIKKTVWKKESGKEDFKLVEFEAKGIPSGYIFGYKDDKITYEDLLYVNPDADPDNPETWEYTHPEEAAVLGKSATGNKRVKFLDPMRYGGKYTKPKLYVEQADHDGWFNVAKMIVPEIDGCSPKRTNFLFLDEISDKVSNIQNSIQTDKRYELEPDCVYEPAYDKLLPPSSHAYIEGIVQTTIRAYSLEVILRTMPIISQLKLDFKTNYADIFLDFIIAKMEDTMQEQGTWPRRIRDYKYWTAFLEQTVQSSFRMLERGDLDKDPELINLLQQALDVSKAYSRPTIEDKRILFLVNGYTLNTEGRIIDAEFAFAEVPNRRKARIVKLLNAMAYEAFGRDFQKELLKLDTKSIKLKTLRLQVLKDAERQLDIHDNIELAKKILKFHVAKELEFYSNKLDEALIPQAYINNLSKFMLGASKMAIVSDTEAGLSEIENPIGDSELPNYGTIPSVPNNNESPFANLTEEQIEQTKEMGGLFLQKYIRVTPNEERTIDIEGMLSFDQFRSAITGFDGDKTQYISEVLGNAISIPELETYEGTIGVKMGVRVCYVLPQGIDPFSSSDELLGAAKAINEDKTYFTNDENGLNYFVPLAHFEQDIVDRTLEEINLQDENLGEDIKCYFDKMVETDEFKFIFESLLITNKVSSLAAIYSYDGFVNSVGLGEGEREEGKEGANRNSFGMEIGWEGKIMDDTKKRLLDLFSSYYLTHERNKDQEQQRERDRKQFLKNLLPDSLFNFDRNVRWFQLRRLVDRPFDKDGKDCAGTLVDVFRGDQE